MFPTEYGGYPGYASHNGYYMQRSYPMPPEQQLQYEQMQQQYEEQQVLSPLTAFLQNSQRDWAVPATLSLARTQYILTLSDGCT